MGDLSENFSRREFSCFCECGFQTVDIELISVLEDLRAEFKMPITINSACRCENHNRLIGGSYGSKHKQGIAADIVIKGVSAVKVYKYLNKLYTNKYGIGKYDTFTHIDVRAKKARWEG
ncbi:MAG: serine/threonine protein kinase [Robiginitomaculum sp.]|nr:MAG: serine/threonine protein kinase [Robiginitomaculum sp.]